MPNREEQAETTPVGMHSLTKTFQETSLQTTKARKEPLKAIIRLAIYVYMIGYALVTSRFKEIPDNNC